MCVSLTAPRLAVDPNSPPASPAAATGAVGAVRAVTLHLVVRRRLDALIRDPVERTYLDADDGYWADLVLSEFSFLEERGGRLAEVAFHQKGDYVTYTGPWGEVVVQFAPDNYPGKWFYTDARLRGRTATFEGDLDRLLRERMPDRPLPPSAPLDRAMIAANVRAWADALRTATDLF